MMYKVTKDQCFALGDFEGKIMIRDFGDGNHVEVLNDGKRYLIDADGKITGGEEWLTLSNRNKR